MGLVFSISHFFITKTARANKWMRKKIPSCSNSALGTSPSRFSYLPKALNFEVLVGWPNQRDVQFDWAVQIRGTKVKPGMTPFLRKEMDWGVWTSSNIHRFGKSPLIPHQSADQSWENPLFCPQRWVGQVFPLSSLVHNIISYIDRWTNQVSLCKYCSMIHRTCCDQNLLT